MMKNLFRALLALTLAFASVPARAQDIETTVLWDYNLNQTVTPIYCALTSAVSTSDRVTASNTTTLTAVSGAPFQNVAVGALLHIIDTNGADYTRAVTVRNSATSVVISGANVTITSGLIQNDSKNVGCGTGVSSGQFAVDRYKFGFSVQVDITQQVNTGGIQFHLQCRASGSTTWKQLSPELTWPAVTSTYETALASPTTGGLLYQVTGVYAFCRVGSFIVTADDGNDLTTNAEQFRILLRGRP